MKAVLTVVGKDRVGIIAQIANLIAENNSNIVNVEQTIMNDKFTMMMEIEFDSEEDFYNLEEKFRKKSDAFKLNIKMYNEDLFNNMYSL